MTPTLAELAASVRIGLGRGFGSREIDGRRHHGCTDVLAEILEAELTSIDSMAHGFAATSPARDGDKEALAKRRDVWTR